MKTPYCIAFAAAAGVGKSPVAIYLSINLNLPIFSNDAIRTEVREDAGYLDEARYAKLRVERLKKLLASKQSFIYESSVDRKWPELKKQLIDSDYGFFIISLDLGKDFIRKLYDAKGYGNHKHLDGWIQDHDNFLKRFPEDIGLSIKESDYPERLQKVLASVR